MTNVLEVSGLTTTFAKNEKAFKVVDDLSLYVAKGEALGIVGESGCGKSVASLSMMRLLGKNGKIEGSIQLNGKEILAYSEKEMQKLRGKEMAMIFQEPMTSLNPVLTVGKQMSEGLEKHEGMKRVQAKDTVIELLTQVGISRASEIYHEYPHRLSGGMRQRVMIAMAIACSPKLLIADEPTTALDVTIQAQILDLIQKVRREMGMSLIMITHDLGVVAETCDRVMVMYAGQVIETADVRSLLRNPKHPYTIGLIQSSPHKAKGQKRLNSIAGSVPSPDEYPKGCRFAPRCDKVMPVCLEHNPQLIEVDQKSQCRCWLYQENSERSAVNV
ncbi:peptide ABC transporter ATP-binding protein [Brevibacillus reuszeri]|uniref:Peptide ABC transporter ATP-binding protein n=1 Tax=Brevibacillus reuszeri TaxID=54915 RepID=A0A0K9YMV4_9BACL|nr:ABC transporter ATP-binding protein [Brevibacillus reuszeri]KNB70001.1 peptide ABC transporter ATP-binding protein [Brevibacillus reuszeri]MED1858370.1 ABC transporter ATP-binding protein [Brevibacillus reuszeri]GED68630.1 peptide ABC transporter ATP-binding protein [Brevibacillus reuszeri]